MLLFETQVALALQLTKHLERQLVHDQGLAA